MKKTILAFAMATALVVSLQSCGSNEATEETTETVEEAAPEFTAYGDEFDASTPISIADFTTSMQEKESMEGLVIEANISEVCQEEGCWMRVKNEGGDDIFVTFNDHQFVIPKDLMNNRVIIYGTGMKKTVSVADLQHYAADAGATAKEIAAITEPKDEIQINATGLLVY